MKHAYPASGLTTAFGCVLISGTPTSVDAVVVNGCCCCVNAEEHVTTVHWAERRIASVKALVAYFSKWGNNDTISHVFSLRQTNGEKLPVEVLAETEQIVISWSPEVDGTVEWVVAVFVILLSRSFNRSRWKSETVSWREKNSRDYGATNDCK